MRAFVVLCLIAVATADVSSLSGYNYQSGSSGGISGGFGGDGGSSHFGGISGDGGSAHFGGISGDGGSGQFGGISGDGGSGQFGGGFGGDGGSGSFGGGLGGGDGGYEKEFYSFSSNDADFDQPDASDQIANAIKRNLQVVFVKGPENRGLENAALSLAKHAADQRTAIYVLNRQTDIGDLANRLNQANSHNRHKPEVHFVKYRTPEDAQNAQHQIQNQYASLGGSSQSHDGGVAPVLNFASKGHIGGGSEHGSYSHSHPSSSYIPPVASYVPPAVAPSHSYISPASPSNSYIPPSIFRRRRF